MEQLKEAQRRVKAAGLADRITMLYCDYRELHTDGTYDALISCEMIEAVGHEHLTDFFAALGRLLKPGGRAVVQVKTHIATAGPRISAHTGNAYL